MADDDSDIKTEFDDLVNMTAKELDEFLGTNDSKDVGQKKEGGESTGHESGRRIVEILKTKKADLSDDDYEHMRKVVGYCKRHLAQRPDGDITDTKWRYSLMNWGHDPKKK
ncbi:DUF3140 domain-containing protein [Rhodococcus sp. 05-2254-5]|jgi:hypothetical protein|uniref:DUF3140 domain-containing protein n=1 Tax=Nocardiaceae TaxID=85025 RepID=UPI00070DA9D0|nr:MULTISPECIES: DUF3140 domain-containing protein [Rhodococcus]KQU29586.1 DNA-binding protein [Rhodococcus sp. Leaf233]MBY4225636.1 DUF3140 domain-containing protein [Rhodococcus fascians]MBY4401848.1 DUF3140 domain-containing protein [Rhodococcus fascians]MBY4415232.1 DUF3140 domain-containing protein [Rhodococcus fascians]MDJ0408107.1 DUF3140 domain-containing protein [Rhodococcus fascians]